MVPNNSYYFELESGASLSQLPTTIGLAEAQDAMTLRTAIASRTNLDDASVHLRGGVYFLESTTSAAGTSGPMANSLGMLVRLDEQLDDAVRTRVCSFTNGQSPVVRADQVVPAAGGAVLVPMTYAGKKLVIAFRQEPFDEEEFQLVGEQLQAVFFADVEAHKEYPAYYFSVGHSSAACE